jgi:glucose/arabinose dehydrogenase
MRRNWPWAAALLAILAAPATAQAPTIAAAPVAGTFQQPVLVTAPAGDPRLFVVDQPGRIWIVRDGQRLDEPFLDIRDRVSFLGERGLLGLAFHPDYAANGRFFINYTDNGGDTRIVAYTVSADPDRAAAASARVILAIDQPAPNHNGGWLGFGPDGYLYIGTGDGGGAGDTYRNGQNRNSLLGKLLRIDVDGAPAYAIPATNPFARGGGAPEIYAWGLRNPWRIDFDGDRLIIADVGQDAWEEVSVISIAAAAGANFGWPIMEGRHCFRAARCDQGGLVLPVYEYSHANGACSITGGYVYRGVDVPALAGHYVFGDYCAGFVRSFRNDGGSVGAVSDWSPDLGDVGRITSFGEDGRSELYVTAIGGRIYRIVAR